MIDLEKNFPNSSATLEEIKQRLTKFDNEVQNLPSENLTTAFSFPTEEESLQNSGFRDQNLENWEEVVRTLYSQESPVDCSKLSFGGVPTEFREVVWRKYTTSDDFEILKNLFQMYKKRDFEYTILIEQDMKRTFPAHPKFKDNEMSQKSLFNICKVI